MQAIPPSQYMPALTTEFRMFSLLWLFATKPPKTEVFGGFVSSGAISIEQRPVRPIALGVQLVVGDEAQVDHNMSETL